MKLSTKSEYALLACVYLAKNSDRYAQSDQISQEYDISKSYLDQILYRLKNNGFVKTRRGSEGGYALRKSAGDINLAEIVRLMDGSLAPTPSVSEHFYEETPIAKERSLVKVMKNIRDYVSDYLEKTKLADII